MAQRCESPGRKGGITPPPAVQQIRPSAGKFAQPDAPFMLVYNLNVFFFSSSRSCHQGFRYCAYGEMLRRQNGTQRLHSKIIGLCKLLRNADTDDLKLPQKSLQEKFNFFPSFACGPLMPGGESMFWFTMCVLDTSTRRVSKTH